MEDGNELNQEHKCGLLEGWEAGNQSYMKKTQKTACFAWFIWMCSETVFFFVLLYLLFDDAEIKGQEVDNQFVSTSPPDLQDAGAGEPHTLPTITGNSIQPDSTAAPQPATIPPFETREKFTCKYWRKCFIFCALQLILWDCQAVVEIWQTQRAALVLRATLAPTPTTCCACGWSGCRPPSWSRSECHP